MSAPVDVLAVMDNAQALVFESGKRGEEWARLIAQSRAAVAELMKTTEQLVNRDACVHISSVMFPFSSHGDAWNALLGVREALARVQGGAA